MEVAHIGESLKSIAEVPSKVDDEKVESLNLHYNQLVDLEGIQRFKGLVELIVSSNNIVSFDLPQLTYLPSLTSLDLSANTITSCADIPFLPGLTSLYLSFNRIQSLCDIELSVPNLRCLDVRGNDLVNYHDIQSLTRLKLLDEVYFGGVRANAVANRASNMARLFVECPVLRWIDNKGKGEWEAMEDAEAAFLSGGSIVVGDDISDDSRDPESVDLLNISELSTPKIDFVTSKFRQRFAEKTVRPGSKEVGYSLQPVVADDILVRSPIQLPPQTDSAVSMLTKTEKSDPIQEQHVKFAGVAAIVPVKLDSVADVSNTSPDRRLVSSSTVSKLFGATLEQDFKFEDQRAVLDVASDLPKQSVVSDVGMKHADGMEICSSDPTNGISGRTAISFVQQRNPELLLPLIFLLRANYSRREFIRLKYAFCMLKSALFQERGCSPLSCSVITEPSEQEIIDAPTNYSPPLTPENKVKSPQFFSEVESPGLEKRNDDSLDELHARYSEKVIFLEEELRQHKDESCKLTTHYLDEISSLRSRLHEFGDIETRLLSTNERLCQENEKLAESLAQQKLELDAIRLDMGKKDEEVKSLSLQVLHLQGAVDNTNHQLKVVGENHGLELKMSTDHANELESKLMRALETVSKLSEQVMGHAANESRLQELILSNTIAHETTLKQKDIEAKQFLDSARSRWQAELDLSTANWEATLSAETSKGAKLEAKFLAAHNAFEEASNRIEQLSKELERAEQTKIKCKHALQELASVTQRQQRELQSLKQAQQQWERAKSQRITTSLTTACTQCIGLRQLEADHAKALSAVREAQAECNRLKTTQQLQRTENENAGNSVSLLAQIGTLQSDLQQKASELEAAQSEIKVSESIATDLAISVKAKDALLEDQLSLILSLRQKITESDQLNLELKGEVQYLEHQLDRCKAESDSMQAHFEFERKYYDKFIRKVAGRLRGLVENEYRIISNNLPASSLVIVDSRTGEDLVTDSDEEITPLGSGDTSAKSASKSVLPHRHSQRQSRPGTPDSENSSHPAPELHQGYTYRADHESALSEPREFNDPNFRVLVVTLEKSIEQITIYIRDQRAALSRATEKLNETSNRQAGAEAKLEDMRKELKSVELAKLELENKAVVDKNLLVEAIHELKADRKMISKKYKQLQQEVEAKDISFSQMKQNMERLKQTLLLSVAQQFS